MAAGRKRRIVGRRRSSRFRAAVDMAGVRPGPSIALEGRVKAQVDAAMGAAMAAHDVLAMSRTP
jgi:hypothetical protein